MNSLAIIDVDGIEATLGIIGTVGGVAYWVLNQVYVKKRQLKATADALRDEFRNLIDENEREARDVQKELNEVIKDMHERIDKLTDIQQSQIAPTLKSLIDGLEQLKHSLEKIDNRQGERNEKLIATLTSFESRLVRVETVQSLVEKKT